MSMDEWAQMYTATLHTQYTATQEQSGGYYKSDHNPLIFNIFF